MRTLPIAKLPHAPKKTPRHDASILERLRVLSEIVTQLSERIEVLEARESLNRAR